MYLLIVVLNVLYYMIFIMYYITLYSYCIKLFYIYISIYMYNYIYITVYHIVSYHIIMCYTVLNKYYIYYFTYLLFDFKRSPLFILDPLVRLLSNFEGSTILRQTHPAGFCFCAQTSWGQSIEGTWDRFPATVLFLYRKWGTPPAWLTGV
jgi:hypothetical protein